VNDDDDEVDEVKGFAPGAYWKTLTQNPIPVPEPENPGFKNARAPTVPEEEGHIAAPIKYHYDEKFDRPVFKGKLKEKVLLRNGRQKKTPDGKDESREIPYEKGRPDPNFVKKQKLTCNAHPSVFFDIFVPFKTNTYNRAGRGEFPSIAAWTKYTNSKAMLANAGPGGQVYPDFRPFTMREIRQHLGIYILQGLNPSPRIEMKFKPDFADVVHGSNLCFNAFGPNAERRHRHFKCFFGVQDPLIQTPPRKKDPNWKVRPLFKWMNYLMPRAWLVGRVFSTDEQTMGFQGHHADKKRITYKDEGDGFQGDALCQDGWTHQIFMRNDPAPKEFIRLGLSPLHSRVLWLFGCLKADYHVCGVDNLYTSAKFCRVSYVKAKVLLNGVTRTGSRGLPKSVLQDTKKKKSDILLARGTVKAAVLIGDPACPNLVAASVYDTKPVHFLSTVCESIRWIEKERLVFNADTGKTEMIKFLRLGINDFYNNSMGHVDLSDQLRNQYRFDHWLRMRKWWWALFLW